MVKIRTTIGNVSEKRGKQMKNKTASEFDVTLNGIEVKQVTTKKEMKKFVEYPVELYKDCSHYVPLLYADEMKLFDKKKSACGDVADMYFFLAYKDGKTVGRVAAVIVYPYLEKSGRKVIRFSRIDFIDDGDVAAALIQAVENVAKKEGLDEIQGPMGYADTDREGMLVEGFGRPSTFAANYNHEYYPKHIESLGFAKEVDWLEYMLHIPSEPNEKYHRIAGMVARRYNLREVAVKGSKMRKLIKAYGKKIFDTVNEAYAPLHGTIPLEGRIVDDIISTFCLFIIPEFLSIVVNDKDEVVGFGTVLSSINKQLFESGGHLTLPTIFKLLKVKKHPETVELALIAVKPEYQKKGINAMVVDKILQGLIEKGITLAETNLELETNSSVVSMWDGIEKDFIKRRRCYIKKVD